MKRLLITIAIAASAMGTYAQLPVNGTTYYLPKTALRYQLLIEKSTYTPGQFAAYADRYMKMRNVNLNPATTYRIVGISMTPIGVPDSSKQRTLMLDKKLSITEVDRDESGILLAINSKGKRTELPKSFKPARKKSLPDPRDYMNGDILSAGSTWKMAELTAQEIYDIRDSRTQLARGQADFMPKDGAQLKIMMDNLDAQEQALVSTFEGTTVKDTTETVLTFVPTQEVDKQLLFRFSKKLGMVDADDLAGEPYYVSVKAAHEVKPDSPEDGKKGDEKDDFGLSTNIPDKITVTLIHDNQPVQKNELYAGQFGKTEVLSAELFGKKVTSHIILNPVSGSIEKIESETLK